jgi:uncharacterized protein (DUF885 family)
MAKNLRGLALVLLVLLLLGGCALGGSTDQVESNSTPAPIHVEASPTIQPTAQAAAPLRSSTDPPPTELPTTSPAISASTPKGSTPAPESAADPAANLLGLSLDDFFEESYKQLLLRNPEKLTALGIAGWYGLRNDQLNDLSESFIRQTQELEAAILDLLRSYDRDQLTAEQQISYDVYEWYLDDLVRGHAFTYHNYPVHHFIGSYQDELIRLLTELHPLANRQDAEDYLSRLAQVDDQVGQLLVGLEKREEIGVIPPKFIVDMTLRDLRDLSRSGARATPFYTAFDKALTAQEGIGDADREALLAEAEEAIDGSVIPAFAALVEYFEHLQSVATPDAGAWKLPNGDAYYAYLLRNQTSTGLTPEEIHQLGLAEVARIQAEIRGLSGQLGYSSDMSMDELVARVAEDGGYHNVEGQAGKDSLLNAYRALLDEADQRLDLAFDTRPEADVVVVGDPGFGGGGYYVSASMDGTRPGAFHTGVGGSWVPKFNMPTIAYHEAIPGHHFQMAIAQEADLPTFRNDLFFNGYGEGWALYAERLASELGLYDDDPYGDLGRLHLELLRAVRLVVDTGIHAEHWTRDEANAYMDDVMGGWTHEVERYVVMPAQATGYKVGMLRILELRQQAMDQLGDDFDLKAFHRVVLGNGSMPLDLLEHRVQDYIDSASLAGAGAGSAGDGRVEGWAVLAQKDDYSDVGMTDLLVDYAGITQLQQLLEEAGWEPDHISQAREFDRTSLQAHLDRLAENADGNDVVFLYVAAHGSYLSDVLGWDDFFAGEWQEIPSQRRLLVIDACQAGKFTSTVSEDPAPHLSIASVAGDEYGWSGLEEEGLPIIGGVFTHYFAAAFDDPDADVDGDALVSAQEAARLAEGQQRTYMHDVVFAVPEFVGMYHDFGVFPDEDPAFPHVVVDDAIGEPLYLALDAYP